MHCLNPRFWLLSFDFSLGTARIGVGVKINIDYLDVENDFPIKHADCPLTILLPPFSTPVTTQQKTTQWPVPFHGATQAILMERNNGTMAPALSGLFILWYHEDIIWYDGISGQYIVYNALTMDIS